MKLKERIYIILFISVILSGCSFSGLQVDQEQLDSDNQKMDYQEKIIEDESVKTSTGLITSKPDNFETLETYNIKLKKKLKDDLSENFKLIEGYSVFEQAQLDCENMFSWIDFDWSSFTWELMELSKSNLNGCIEIKDKAKLEQETLFLKNKYIWNLVDIESCNNFVKNWLDLTLPEDIKKEEKESYIEYLIDSQKEQIEQCIYSYLVIKDCWSDLVNNDFNRCEEIYEIIDKEKQLQKYSENYSRLDIDKLYNLYLK